MCWGVSCTHGELALLAAVQRTGLTAGDDTLVRAGDKLPADSLVLSTKNIWSIIKSQKDLNLPAHKVGARCSPPVSLLLSEQAYPYGFAGWFSAAASSAAGAHMPMHGHTRAACWLCPAGHGGQHPLC